MGILINCVDICNPYVHEYSKKLQNGAMKM
jgi:hypothetical protein